MSLKKIKRKLPEGVEKQQKLTKFYTLKDGTCNGNKIADNCDVDKRKNITEIKTKNTQITNKKSNDGNGSDLQNEETKLHIKETIENVKSHKNKKPGKPTAPIDESQRLLLHKTQETLSRLHHCLIPAFNVHPFAMNFWEMRNFPKCLLTSPKPIYIADKHSERIDICHLRTLQYQNYYKRLEHCYIKYQTASKIRKVRALEKEDEYHRAVFDLADRMAHHPDPYFNCRYDYYYTGGNLCKLPESNIVLHVGGKNLQELIVSQLSTPEFMKLSNKTFSNDNSEIFEIKPLRYIDKYKNSFAVRQKNGITLGSLRDDYTVKTFSYIKSDNVPFISFAQSQANSNIFFTTTMESKLLYFDTTNGQPRQVTKYDMISEMDNNNNSKWNIIRTWKDDKFIFANERNLHIVDQRTKAEEWLKSACGSPTDEYSCDFISTLTTSHHENLVYVGTAHKLHCLDVRYLGENFEDTRYDGGICRWTHQLQYSPIFIENFICDNEEFVIMASPLAGDLCVCELTKETTPKVQYRSYTLSYQPPTLQEAYDHARIAGHCLQPEADLNNRIQCCTTGLSFHEVDTNLNAMLLLANSNGDVYRYEISKRHSQDSEERCNEASDKEMARYSKTICDLLQPPLNYTSIVDMKTMRKVFTSDLVHLKDEDVPSDTIEEKKWKRQHMGRWQKSMHKLYGYKDALVKDLLSIWDIDFEKDAHISMRKIDERLDHELDTKCKVNEWLNYNEENSKPIINIFNDVLSKDEEETTVPTIQDTIITTRKDENRTKSMTKRIKRPALVINSETKSIRLDIIDKEQANVTNSSEMSFNDSDDDLDDTNRINSSQHVAESLTEKQIDRQQQQQPLNISMNKSTVKRKSSKPHKKKIKKKYVKGF